ncbi:MAG: RNA polymerase sigma factor [Spirosomataceae bacterium]
MTDKSPSKTPEELLLACVKGDRKSQEMLYRQFYGFAMGVCLRYTQTKDEASEVVNDGFLKVFTKGEQFDPKYPFKVWLRRIMVNTALDFYRSQQKHYNHQNIEEAYEVSGDDNNAIGQMTYDELMSLVHKLPPAYKVVFSLYVIDGFSHEEISSKLGISVGTSKSNLSRARESLRQMLSQISKEKINY